jgi:hypothetical protein
MMGWVCAADVGGGSVQPLHARGARGAAAQEGAGQAGGGRRGLAHPRRGGHRRRDGRRRRAVRGAAIRAPRCSWGPLPGPPRSGRHLPCRHRGVPSGTPGRLGVRAFILILVPLTGPWHLSSDCLGAAARAWFLVLG